MDEKFVKETFWALLSKPDIKNLTIPIIQRSYTQGGRISGGQPDSAIETKGSRFISRLCDALIHDNPIELDFVYTSHKNDILYPLDGQQRLTTLFLLHWYIAQKEKRLQEEISAILRKFTYETRVSSRYFCEKLTSFVISEYYQNDIEDTIKNQKWFLLSWLHDPSVLSMLGMLKKIDGLLRTAEKEMWEKLTQHPDTAPITFFYTPLERFDLTDDLYIKMNARGKELTSFENTKAEFNKKIDDEGWDNEKPTGMAFGHKVDTDWTDLFWKFRDDKNEIDVYFLKFISAVLVNYYTEKRKQEYAQKLFNNPLKVTPKYLDRGSYDYLYDCLESFCKCKDAICDADAKQFNIVFWIRNTSREFSNLYQFFELFISKTDTEFSWQERVIFYGICLYLKQNSTINIKKMTDWLIFIRNLISNGVVDSYEPFRSAQNRLSELSDGTTDIYTHLTKITESAAKGFSEDQMHEELKKAKVYQNTPKVKSDLQELENGIFCQGKLRFVFYCLDITDRVSDIESLKKLKAAICNNLQNNELSNEFKRAMFTITDFWFYRSWCYFLSENKYCIISNIEQLRSYYAFNNDNAEYLKKLLFMLFDNTFTNIIDSFKKTDDMPKWKWRLITESGLLDECWSNHITIDKKHCYLLQAQRPSRDYQCVLVK